MGRKCNQLIMSRFLKDGSAVYKWAMLVSFSLIIIMIQVFWLNFAPVLSFISHRYNTSDFITSLLVLVFPLFYIIFSFPAGIVIDRYGYERVVLTAGLAIAFFALLRCCDQSFVMLLIGQCGIAISQPFVMNALSSLVVDLFPKKQHALATGCITAGIFIGMALGLGVTPVLINTVGLRETLIISFCCGLVVTSVFVLLAYTNRSKPYLPPVTGNVHVFFGLFRQKGLLTIFILAFLAMGYFNGLISWMEPMMASKGISSEQAGFAGAIIMLGGIAGSLIIPFLSDRIGKRRPFIILCAFVGVLVTWPLYMSVNVTHLLLFCCLLGGFFLPGYCLLLTMAEESSSEESVGRVTSIFMLFGNAGGVIVIALMPLLNGSQSSWDNAVYFLLLLVVTALFLSFRLKDTGL